MMMKKKKCPKELKKTVTSILEGIEDRGPPPQLSKIVIILRFFHTHSFIHSLGKPSSSRFCACHFFPQFLDFYRMTYCVLSLKCHAFGTLEGIFLVHRVSRGSGFGNERDP